MKKAIKVNLGRLIFHIDEDAYDKLKDYLSALSSHFGNETEAKEIVSDVESRIAEILQSRTSQGKQVIEIKDIDEVIGILGNPSDFDTESKEEKSYSTNAGTYSNQRRRFYRDVDNAVFGGVCSGLGAYFNLDPVIFRIIFVMITLFGGAGVPVYLILWIAIPAARTAAQKLEMHGEDVNISNIEKTVKREYEQVRENFKRIDARSQFRDFFQELVHVVKVVLVAIFKIFAVFIGIILTIVGICLIIAFSAIFLGHHGMISSDNVTIGNLTYLMEQFGSHGHFIIFFIVTFLLFFIPVCWIIYLGLKLIFRFKSRHSHAMLGSLALWIMSIIIFIVLIVTTVNNFNEENSIRSSLNLETKSYMTLYLKLNPADLDRTNLKLLLAVDEKSEYYVSKNKEIFGRPRLIINNSETKGPNVNIEKESRGETFDKAFFNAREINYGVIQKDSNIFFDPYFIINPTEKWRMQKVDIDLNIPTGTVIYIDNNMAPILKFTENTENIWYKELIGRKWIMTENGLAPYGKKTE